MCHYIGRLTRDNAHNSSISSYITNVANRFEMLSRMRHSSLLDLFMSYAENEEL